MTSPEMAEALSQLAYGGGAGLGIAAGLAFFRWTATFIAGRFDKRQAQIDASTERLIKGLENRLQEEIESRIAEGRRRDSVEDALRQELSEFRSALSECERKHAESEARVAQLEGYMHGRGKARGEAALIVATEKAKDKE